MQAKKRCTYVLEMYPLIRNRSEPLAENDVEIERNAKSVETKSGTLILSRGTGVEGQSRALNRTFSRGAVAGKVSLSNFYPPFNGYSNRVYDFCPTISRDSRLARQTSPRRGRKRGGVQYKVKVHFFHVNVPPPLTTAPSSRDL